jgi:hypothetical protein
MCCSEGGSYQPAQGLVIAAEARHTFNPMELQVSLYTVAASYLPVAARTACSVMLGCSASFPQTGALDPAHSISVIFAAPFHARAEDFHYLCSCTVMGLPGIAHRRNCCMVQPPRTCTALPVRNKLGEQRPYASEI